MFHNQDTLAHVAAKEDAVKIREQNCQAKDNACAAQLLELEVMKTMLDKQKALFQEEKTNMRVVLEESEHHVGTTTRVAEELAMGNDQLKQKQQRMLEEVEELKDTQQRYVNHSPYKCMHI